jgi:prevent-host-death family protein
MERKISVRQLNQQTSAVFNEVARGAAVTITSDGRPGARLVPMADQHSDLDDLVEGGRASGPTVMGPVPIPPAYGSEALDVAAALFADREEQAW